MKTTETNGELAEKPAGRIYRSKKAVGATAEIVAGETGVSAATIKRDGLAAEVSDGEAIEPEEENGELSPERHVKSGIRICKPGRVEVFVMSDGLTISVSLDARHLREFCAEVAVAAASFK